MKKFSSRLLALLLAALMIVSLAACGGDQPSGGETTPPEEEELVRGLGLQEDFEEVAELDEDSAPARAVDPVLQNVLTKLDGTPLGSDAYLYRDLLSEDYRVAYDLIRAGILAGKTEIPLSVSVPKADIKQIYRAVFYDSPDLFWMNGSYSYSYNKYDVVTKVKPKYNDLVNDIAGSTAKFEGALKDALADMWTLKTPAEQVKYAHDYLVSTVEYDLGATYDQTAFSAVVNHKSVCAGYSRAFQYMMQKMGIRCTYIVGVCSSPNGSGSHAWNLLELDGEYYAMDVTWDDPIGAKPGKYYYDYFNITDKAISADHARTDPSTALPAAAGTAMSFASAFGGSQFGTDFDAITGKLPDGYGSASTAFITKDNAIADNPYLP